MKILSEGKIGEIVSEIFIENFEEIKENIDKKEYYEIIECGILNFVDIRGKNLVTEFYSNQYDSVMNDLMPLCQWFYRRYFSTEFLDKFKQEPVKNASRILGKISITYVFEEIFKRNITMKNIYDFINEYGTDKNWEDFNDKLYNLGINIENI